MRPPPGRSGHHRPRVVSAALLCIAVSACSRHRPTAAANQPAQREVVRDALKHQLEMQPHIESVEAVYQDNFTAPGTLAITMHAQAGSYPEPTVLLDVAEREVWRSRLRPLDVIFLDAYDASAPPRAGVLRLPDDEAALIARHGSRRVRNR